MDAGVAVRTHSPVKDMLLVSHSDVLGIPVEANLLVKFSAYAGAVIGAIRASQMAFASGAEPRRLRVAGRTSEHGLNGAGR